MDIGAPVPWQPKLPFAKLEFQRPWTSRRTAQPLPSRGSQGSQGSREAFKTLKVKSAAKAFKAFGFSLAGLAWGQAGRKQRKQRVGLRAQPVETDVVVIGSGLAGLTCAGVLAAAGKSVTVLESHYVPGGAARASTCCHSNCVVGRDDLEAHTFRARAKGIKGDFCFDSGPSLYGGLSGESAPLRVQRRWKTCTFGLAKARRDRLRNFIASEACVPVSGLHSGVAVERTPRSVPRILGEEPEWITYDRLLRVAVRRSAKVSHLQQTSGQVERIHPRG